MPFAQINAPGTFQHALDLMLTRLKWQSCLFHVHDIIIYSNSVEEHIRHVDEHFGTKCMFNALENPPQGFHFEFEYKTGRENTQSDELLRFLTASKHVLRDADNIPLFACEE